MQIYHGKLDNNEDNDNFFPLVFDLIFFLLVLSSRLPVARSEANDVVFPLLDLILFLLHSVGVALGDGDNDVFVPFVFDLWFLLFLLSVQSEWVQNW